MRTVPEAARYLNRHPETIRRWIREGKLPAVKVGTQHLIDDRDLAKVVPRSGRPTETLPAALSDDAIVATINRGREERMRQIMETLAPYLSQAGEFSRAPRDVDTYLPAIVGRIVRLVDPVRILLFGSRARGDAGPESDYDILVVLDDAPNPRERRIAIRRALVDLPVAIDVVVVGADRVGLRAGLPRGIVNSALNEGREVYARG